MTIEKKYADRIDMRFKWVGSASTDISKTFARIRKQQADPAAKAAEVQSEAQLKVRKLK